MTRPVNIYTLSRIRDEETFNIIEFHESQSDTNVTTPYHEIESLRLLVDDLIYNGQLVSELDGFFHGFSIPQIGKEFDLLKFTDSSLINIELKSQEVPESQIKAQLIKNRHYLSHLSKRLNLFTVVTNTMSCYKLSVSGDLIKAETRELVSVIRKHNTAYMNNIDDLFKASEYLVSPFNTPGKFIRGEYFLTQAQDQIKKDVLKSVESVSGWACFHITGTPGTGKTLLLYDIARELSKSGRTLIIYYGEITDSLRLITDEIDNLTILSVEDATGPAACSSSIMDSCLSEEKKLILNNYDFLLIDESHRLSEYQFNAVIASAKAFDQICIFSSDPEQVLTTTEKKCDIAGRIAAIPDSAVFTLSEKIRMNREMFAFITSLKNINRKKEFPATFSNINLNYANTSAEAQNLLEYYRKKDYVFINYAHYKNSFTPFSDFEEDFDTHHVIGREFDKVVMLMDDSFYYNENGILKGVPLPDPDYLYPNLFYQAVTRVREKLALIILDAPELFKSIASIFTR